MSSIETLLKLSWSSLEALLKLSWSSLKALLNLSWRFLKAPLKCCRKSSETPEALCTSWAPIGKTEFWVSSEDELDSKVRNLENPTRLCCVSIYAYSSSCRCCMMWLACGLDWAIMMLGSATRANMAHTHYTHRSQPLVKMFQMTCLKQICLFWWMYVACHL